MSTLPLAQRQGQPFAQPFAHNLALLAAIHQYDRELAQYFSTAFQKETPISRSFVSFQANKELPCYRWYKYKEAFSAPLVDYLFHVYGIWQGRLLDPFAGSGTALFAAQTAGLYAHGIELLPIGQQIILARVCLETIFTSEDMARIEYWATTQPWLYTTNKQSLPTLRITNGAYADETRAAIEHYLAALHQENQRVQTILRFALLCILESISYTRKDGQYLRWDYRSSRRQGAKPFNKGYIPNFSQAMVGKIHEIIADTQNVLQQMTFFGQSCGNKEHGNGNGQYGLELDYGSSLDILPTLPTASYDVIMTSPPYCNRYDYTRTYALELALLGVNEQELTQLRQQMISCTVEHRAKDLIHRNPRWQQALRVADQQPLLQAILHYLEHQKATKQLNNNGIPRMVRGYFYEMACVIAECARVLKPGSRLFMVNDNVRYAGASISVDMLLSHMAEHLGFQVESILVLPNGKGNSSQQMGLHGRDMLRKCVYVWRKHT